MAHNNSIDFFILCCNGLKSDGVSRAEWRAKEAELQNSLQKEKDDLSKEREHHVRFEVLQDKLKNRIRHL